MKINDLDTRKGQIDSNYYNVEMCKRNLQRQITQVQNLQANAVGELFQNEKKNSNFPINFVIFFQILTRKMRNSRKRLKLYSNR